MKNEFYKFDEIAGTSGDTEYTYRDYTSERYSEIYKWDEIYDDAWTYIISLADNTKIETVSNDLYGTPDYWDLILGINNRSPLFDMAYDQDIIEADVAESLIEFQQYSILSTSLLALVESKLRADIEEKNENNRLIRVIRPERLKDFLRLMRSRGYDK